MVSTGRNYSVKVYSSGSIPEIWNYLNHSYMAIRNSLIDLLKYPVNRQFNGYTNTNPNPNPNPERLVEW